MYLLDASVIAELRRAKSGRADDGVVTWANSAPAQNLFVSTISLLELDAWAAKSEKKAKADNGLRAWVSDQVMPAFEGRILPVDAAVVKRRATLPHSDQRPERNALLAATALVHGLSIVTRDPAAFRATRAKVFNPWGYQPGAPIEVLDWQEEEAKGSAFWLRNLFVRS